MDTWMNVWTIFMDVVEPLLKMAFILKVSLVPWSLFYTKATYFYIHHHRFCCCCFMSRNIPALLGSEYKLPVWPLWGQWPLLEILIMVCLCKLFPAILGRLASAWPSLLSSLCKVFSGLWLSLWFFWAGTSAGAQLPHPPPETRKGMDYSRVTHLLCDQKHRGRAQLEWQRTWQGHWKFQTWSERAMQN